MKSIMKMMTIAFGLATLAMAGPGATVRYNALYDLDAETGTQSITRAYLEYKGEVDSTFKGRVTLDVLHDKIYEDADPADTNTGIALAYLKYAMGTLTNTIPRTTLNFGLIPTLSYLQPYKHWGYAYLANPVTLDYKMTSSADLGVSASIKLVQNLNLEVGIYKGDGYKQAYGDIEKPEYAVNIVYISDLIQGSIFNSVRIPKEDDDEVEVVTAGFIGMTMNGIRAGLELASMINKDGSKDDKNQVRAGALYLAVPLPAKLELVGRGEYKFTAEDDQEELVAQGGLTYQPVKKVNITALFRFAKNWAKDTEQPLVGLKSELSF